MKINPYLEFQETPKEKLIQLIAGCEDDKLILELIQILESYVSEPIKAETITLPENILKSLDSAIQSANNGDLIDDSEMDKLINHRFSFFR